MGGDAVAMRDTLAWVVDIFTRVGVPLALVGVFIAIRESNRSRTVATAAQKAVSDAERQLSGNHLIGLSGQFESIESDLMKAINDDQKDRCNDVLIRWRQEANELIGLLEHREHVDEKLLTSFQKLVTTIGLVQAELPDSNAHALVITKDLRLVIPEALGHLSRYAGTLKMTAHENGSENAWASSGLTDIQHQGHAPGKDVQNGDHGEAEAASAALVHSGVQG
jgi:hypothetical protein